MNAPTALIATHQIPLIEPNWDDSPCLWRIWISYDKTRTAGTYLELHHDGMITRSTLMPTGEVCNTVTIKPKG